MTLSLKTIASLFFLMIACFTPLIWRLVHSGITQPPGILSDALVGLLILLLVNKSNRWFRILIFIPWTLFTLCTFELVAAMQRFPYWQDVHYIADTDFLTNSTSTFSFAYPELSVLFIIAALYCCIFPLKHKVIGYIPIFSLIIIIATSYIFFDNRYNRRETNNGIIGRYSPLHWFLVDAITSPFSRNISTESINIPSGLTTLDMNGTPLFTAGKAKNVLIIALEGIPGMYYPEIAQAMGMVSKETEIPTLAALVKSTTDAMLVPDFSVHSHQTIRGLYSMLCGDFSKLSWTTPKAFELQNNPDRAQDCLPAQMASHGWGTHYLQGANLGFMGKDRFMPLIGFQQVHGSEWFSEANPYPFGWGAVDSVFFRGARTYIATLQKQEQPWMLTLLTVGTHQPYGVPDDIAEQYPSKKIASVALLDQAVGEFIENLGHDKVLEDTLVIITSDESHGSHLAPWISSWGLAVILTPEQLPRIKKGGFGLVDTTVSVLDYFGIQPPSTLKGRSFFRDYITPRAIISSTSSGYRWHTSDNQIFECSADGRCRAGKGDSFLGSHTLQDARFNPDIRALLGAIIAKLDNNLTTNTANTGRKTLQFASGETHNLPEKITSEWAESLVGAQYLDFPAKSRVHVSIKVKAVNAPTDGITLQLLLKQSERPCTDIIPPVFPLLYTGDEKTVEFDFNNPQARNSFSFYLLGAGKDAAIRIDAFEISWNIEGEK